MLDTIARRAVDKLYVLIARPLYWFYEKKLYREIKNGEMPRHIGIIPDGNRRWARRHGYQYFLGHRYGYDKMQEVLEWIWQLGIKYVTVYAMSSENCIRRSPEERMHLFQLIADGLGELKEDPRTHERRIRIRVIGNLDLIPDQLRSLIDEIEEATSRYGERFLNIAVCYGGRHEIIEAIKRVSQDYKEGKIDINDVDENFFSRYLFTDGQPDPDLIIRTSGEERISNFLLWQSAYSELYFTDIYWPEFRRIDLWRAIRSYQKRKRNFGS